MQKQRISDEHPWLKVVGAVAVGFLICISVCLLKKLFQQTDTVEIIRILSDAFLLAGVVELGAGLLSWLKKDGTYDGLGYSFHTLRMSFVRRRMSEEDRKAEGRTYDDYKQKVGAKRKVAWHLIFSGAGFLTVAIVLTIVFFAIG